MDVPRLHAATDEAMEEGEPKAASLTEFVVPGQGAGRVSGPLRCSATSTPECAQPGARRRALPVSKGSDGQPPTPAACRPGPPTTGRPADPLLQTALRGAEPEFVRRYR